MVTFLKLLCQDFSTSHSLSGMYMRHQVQSGHIWACATVRATPNVKRSPTWSHLRPAINLPPKWLFKWIHIPNPHVPHLLKNKFPKISLLQNNSIFPLYTDNPFTGLSASHFTWGWGAGLTQLLPPCWAQHLAQTVCSVNVYYVNKWVDEYSISEIQHQAQWKYCKKYLSSWKSTRMLTPPGGKGQGLTDSTCSISHAHPCSSRH